MPSVHIRPADQVPLTALATALNRAYSDYYIPIYVDEVSLHAMLKRDDVALAHCAVALDEGEVIGTGLLGVRGTSGWIGGMGVVPHKRRQGIGRRVLGYLIARARALGVRMLRLEVVEENTGAHTLYREHGFRDIRHLHTLERPPQRDDTLAAFHNNYTITQEAPQTLLAHYEEFHAVRNCWQRDLPSLARLTPFCRGWALYDADTLQGYILGQLAPHSVLVFDIATKTNGPQGAAHAAALLAHLHNRHTHTLGHAYNVAEDDPAMEAYHALGYQTHLRQIEMGLALD